MCQTSEGSELKDLRMDSENKLSPDLHVNAGMRRRLITAYRSSGGWGVAWQSPAAWASTSHLMRSHQITHSLLDLALLPVIAHGFDQRCAARLTLSVFLSPAFLRPSGPPTRGKQRQQKATNMLQKKKIYALSTSLFDWQKNTSVKEGTDS